MNIQFDQEQLIVTNSVVLCCLTDDTGRTSLTKRSNAYDVILHHPRR